MAKKYFPKVAGTAILTFNVVEDADNADKLIDKVKCKEEFQNG